MACEQVRLLCPTSRHIEHFFSVLVDMLVFLSKKFKFLPSRRGERYSSSLTNMNLSNKVYKIFGKIDLKDYLKDIVNK